MFSEYEQKQMEVMKRAGEVLGDRTPISTFGAMTSATLVEWAEAHEESPGRAATAHAVLKQRAATILDGVPPVATPFDQADALMSHMGIGSDAAMRLVEELS